MMHYSDRPLSIKQWAEEDRPREKLLLKGRTALTDAELIGILIGSGTQDLSAVELSKQILSAVGNDLHALAKLTVKDLVKFKGIGEAKAISIVSALELGRRRKEAEPTQRTVIRSSADIYALMKPYLLDLPHEEFWVVLLNRANQVLKKNPISAGGITGTVVDPRLIFKAALDELATGIILVHNHPSGNLKASTQDMDITKKLVAGGKVLDIAVLDHLIFTNSGYLSFADENLM
jgi:DNA repair protein RadC